MFFPSEASGAGRYKDRKWDIIIQLGSQAGRLALQNAYQDEGISLDAADSEITSFDNMGTPLDLLGLFFRAAVLKGAVQELQAAFYEWHLN